MSRRSPDKQLKPDGVRLHCTDRGTHPHANIGVIPLNVEELAQDVRPSRPLRLDLSFQGISKTPRCVIRVYAGIWRIETFCKRCGQQTIISSNNAHSLLGLDLKRSVDLSIYTLGGIAAVEAQEGAQ